MKRPTWATIVGVMAIIFGCLGILGAVQTAVMPKIMEAQKKMLQSIPVRPTANATQGTAEAQADASVEQATKLMDAMWGEKPSWFGAACVAIGVVGLAVNAFYLFAGISLLQMKPTSIQSVTTAVFASMGYTIARVIIFMQGASVMGWGMAAGAVVSLSLDLILLIVVKTSGKAGFTAPA